MMDPESERAKRNSAIPALLFLTASYAAGFVGSFPMNEALSFWYLTLERPGWSLPPQAFAPAWTVYFGLSGIAAWLVWSSSRERAGGRRTLCLLLFGAQLLLTCLWMWLFFGWRLGGVALWVAGILGLTGVAQTVLYGKARPLAGVLVALSHVWTAYLLALTWSVYRLN